MGHLIRWDNPEKTVILQQYATSSSKSDLYQLAEESAALIKTVEHMVHIIIDERNIELTLISADMKYLEKLVPPNQGTVVVVVRDTIYLYKNALNQVGQVIAPHAFRKPYFSRTVEEARNLLIEKHGVVYPSSDLSASVE